MIRLQAHRGASRHYPENTIVAYEGALREHYQLIELDPKFTKDHQCVMLHDFTVNRTARMPDGRKIDEPTDIRTLTLAEVRALDFGVGFAPEFAGTQIPLFGEVLDFAKSHRASIKVDNVLESLERDDQEQMFRMVQEADAASLVGFTCKTVSFAHWVAAHFPDSELHYDGPVSPEILESLVSGLHHNALTVWLPAQKKSWLTYPPADAETVEMTRAFGKIGLWTAVDDASLARCLALHPDAMEIDGTVTPEMVNGPQN